MAPGYYEALSGLLLALPPALLGLALIAASRGSEAPGAPVVSEYSAATAAAWRRTAALSGYLLLAVALASAAASPLLGVEWQALILAAGLVSLQAVVHGYAVRQAELTQLSEPPAEGEEWEPVPAPTRVEAAALLLVTAAALYAAAGALLAQAPAHVKAVPLVLSAVQVCNTLSTLRGHPPVLPRSPSPAARAAWLGLQSVNGALALLTYTVIT